MIEEWLELSQDLRLGHELGRLLDLLISEEDAVRGGLNP